MSASRDTSNTISANYNEDERFQEKWEVFRTVLDYPCWNELISIDDGNYRKALVNFERKFGLYEKSWLVNKDDETYSQDDEAYSQLASMTTPLITENKYSQHNIKEAIEKFTREEREIWKNGNCVKLFTEHLQQYAKTNNYSNFIEEITRIKKIIEALVTFFDDLYDKINDHYGFLRIIPEQKLDLKTIMEDFQDNINQIITNFGKDNKPVAEPIDSLNKKTVVVKSNMNPRAIIIALQEKIFDYFDKKKTRIVTGFFGGKTVNLLSKRQKKDERYANVSYYTELMLNEIAKVMNNHRTDKNINVLQHIAGLSFRAVANDHAGRTRETQYFYQSIEKIIDPIESLKKIKSEIISNTTNNTWGLHYLNCYHTDITINSEQHSVPNYVEKMWSYINEADGLFNKNPLSEYEVNQSRDLLRQVLNIAQVDSQAKLRDRFFRWKNIQHFYKNITDHLVLVPQTAQIIDNLQREKEKHIGFLYPG